MYRKMSIKTVYYTASQAGFILAIRVFPSYSICNRDRHLITTIESTYDYEIICLPKRNDDDINV